MNLQAKTIVTSVKQILRNVWPFLTLSLTAGLLKISAIYRLDKIHSYSLHFDVASILEGIRFCVSSLLYWPDLTLSFALIFLFGLGIIPIILRSKTLCFGYTFILISILPILPLANRRADYHLYIPLIGVSIYVAQLLCLLEKQFNKRRERFLPVFYGLVIAFFLLHSQRNWILKKPLEDNYLEIANENREFVKLMQRFKPAQGTLYFYDSAPRVLAPNSGVYAVINLLFDDWTAIVESTQDCDRNIPPPDKTDVACISFKKRAIKSWRASNVQQ
jgi:hypothetical protein